MALPIIETPRYELTLPSSDVQVQYRPFVVKEEKYFNGYGNKRQQRNIMQQKKY